MNEIFMIRSDVRKWERPFVLNAWLHIFIKEVEINVFTWDSLMIIKFQGIEDYKVFH